LRQEGLGQLKNPMTFSGIELATFLFNIVVSNSGCVSLNGWMMVNN
jgi:hypothetical protein